MRFRLMSLAIGAVTSGAEAQVGRGEVRAIAIPLITGVTLTPASVTGGTVVSGAVTISQAAGGNGITVTFRSSNPALAAVPVNVVVQPGARSATFAVQTNPVATNPNVVTEPPFAEISAQLGNSAPRTVRLTVLPTALASVTVTPTSVPGGSSATGEVRITGPAAAPGFTVTLAAKPTGAEPPVRSALLSVRRQGPVVTVPPQVTIPAGATSVPFPVVTGGVTEPTPAQVTASRGQFASKTTSITLLPPALAGVSEEAPDSPVGGTSATVTVSLTAPAPPGGTAFSLYITGSGCGPKLTVPASVEIPAGAGSATFPITTYPGGGLWRIHAGGKSVEVLVREPLLGSNALMLPASVKGGTTVQGAVQLYGAAGPPNCNNTRKLESSNPLYAQVPQSVTLTPGSDVAPFQITTSAVTTLQTVTITVYGNVGYGYASRQATMTITP